MTARAVVAGIAGSLATVVLVVAATGWWSVHTVPDSDWVAPRVDALLADPVVSEALAERVVDSVVDELIEGAAQLEVLPGVAVPLVGIALEGIRPEVDRRVAGIVRQERVRAAVASASARAYDAVIAQVRDESTVHGARIVGDEVRLDLLPVVGVVLESLRQFGFFPDLEVPDLSTATDGGTGRDERRAALAAALGRELPAGFGEIVVYRGDAVEQAGDGLATVQQLFVMAGRVTWLSFAAGISLTVVALVLSHRRRRAAALITAGLVAEMLVLQLVTARLVRSARDLVTEPAARIAVVDLVGELQQRLVRTGWVVVVLTVAVMVTALAVAERRGRSLTPGATDAHVETA